MNAPITRAELELRPDRQKLTYLPIAGEYYCDSMYPGSAFLCVPHPYMPGNWACYTWECFGVRSDAN